MVDFGIEIKEIDSLYSKAVKESEYKEVIAKAEKLEERMFDAGEPVGKIALSILNGFWAHYYWVKDFAGTSDNIRNLENKVNSYYMGAQDPGLKVSYGYLLSVIVSELKKEPSEADSINEEVKKIAEESGNIVSILRNINARGIKEMGVANFTGAIEIFDEIKRFEEISKEAFRHAGNIINNRGASKIRGDIDILSGVQDLVSAARNYYLKERPLPWKHLEGIKNRLNEAGEKIIEQAKNLEKSS